eukprot:TRINITY_DN10476_c0_g1_i2.p1 TRINITY_DN10476_c0_g1~~TRINITY_DN10476_c0_g1_i2.p1  ORF type:complete len:443 (-),score=133.59 TRINITY_DN10476_c0_g1_i2:34-1362(-)
MSQFIIAPQVDHQTANLRPSFGAVIEPQTTPILLSPRNWSDSHQKLLATAESHECGAVQAVVDSELARDDTSALSKLQLRLTNDELGNRINATEELKGHLEDAVARMQAEAARIAEEVEELTSRFNQHESTQACLREVQRLRLTRTKSERVMDSVEHELKLFNRSLQAILYPPRAKKLLAMNDVLSQLLEQVSEDAARKGIAIQVDNTCLDSQAPKAAVKQLVSKAAKNKPAAKAQFDSVRVTPTKQRGGNQSTHAWVTTTMKILQKCNKSLKDSTSLRAAAEDYRDAHVGIYGDGCDRLEQALRVCIQQLEQATEELLAGKAEIDKDLEADRVEIAELVASMPALQAPLELAEARLIKRARRPVPERVRDSAEKALDNEAQTQRLSLAKLRGKQKKLEANRGRLLNLKKEILNDVALKKETLAINEQCLQTVVDHQASQEQ